MEIKFMASTCVAQRRADPFFNTTQAGIAKLSKNDMQKILSYLSIEAMGSVHQVQRSWHSLMPNIERLCLSTRITDTALTHILQKFKQNKINLNSICFDGCKEITRSSLSQLSLHPITTLTLLETTITCKDIASIPIPLKDLSLDESEIADMDLFALAPLLLTTLSLSDTAITDFGLSDLAHLPLTELDLSKNNITGKCLYYLSNIPLTKLDLSGTAITDNNLKLLKNRSLTTLDLSDCTITGTGFTSPESLISLRNLNLCGSKISDVGLTYVSRLPLIKLNLSGNDITDTGLEYLSHLSSLRQLSLGFCKKITDLGLTSLAKMQLTRLNLSDTNITDFGIPSFIKMSLEKLCVSDTKITARGIEYLQKMPLLVLSSENCYWNYGFGLPNRLHKRVHILEKQ
jgi:hypothetical protein